MSLANETVRALYSANGTTTSFAIPHDIIESDSSEVEVYVIDESVDPITETLQVEGALQDYTLTGASPPGTPFDTHVVFNSAPASGLKVLVQRVMTLTQPTDLDENSAVPMEDIETTLDRIVAEIQLINLKLSRAPKVRQSAPSANLNPSLPEPDSGKFLRWNTAETGFENASPVGGPGSTISGGTASTDNALVRWNGTAGDTIQNSGIIVDDSDNVTGVASIEVAGNIRNTQLTASRAVVTDADKDLASSATTATELSYLNGVTSAIQTQLDGKQASGNYITDLTGDVTASGPGSVAATIADEAVTNAKLAHMAQSTIKGRAAGAGTGDATDLTATQATAILDAVVGDSGAGGTKGLVPAPAAGDAAANKFLKADGTWAVVTSGGGSVALRWYTPDSNAALKKVLSNGLEVYEFNQSDDEQVIFCKFTLPESYSAGDQIFLKKGKAFSPTNSGNFLFKATSYIFKANIDGTSTPTGHASTNSQQAVDATGNEIVTINDIDLSDATGQINSVALAAGDTVLVKLIRDTSAETSGVADVVNLLIDAFELDITV